MNLIDFTKNGGYRFKQFTLRKMQEAYLLILKSFVAFCNIPETGNYIISGMQISGANITAGYCYIDGELCRFEQTAGTVATKIKKNVVIQSLGFKNGNNEDVFRFVNAQVDAVDGVALSSFTRVYPVFDANYVHTDNNFTTALLNKLLGIEPGAEVNIQADWNVVNTASDAYIKNKPTILNVLYKGTYLNMGDIFNNDYVINFPNVGTSNYSVYVSFESTTLSAGQSATYVYVVHSKMPTQFTVRMNETGNHVQVLTMNYLIIAN
ncbi:MAG: hypothetical protein C0525_01305 [Flavobacterium sp.]|uniref:hypothetical protein n=1 Tax=Flavobacterium sp. TaxID=239 RepID=UPI0025BC36B9|nr:hypothetical protein [Flavobacterium sp.]MBA4133338.1 hypothetical protein [Flavobacterium sp.]